MNHVYLLTGGNIGHRHQELSKAASKLAATCGPIIDQSSIFETAPWGKPDQAKFLNQALVIETTHSPKETLSRILEIEMSMGRKRQERFGARTIDIDIIFYNHLIIDEPGLKIPHPEMQNRRFVLEPLTEIAPAFIHPILHKTLRQLLEECKDPLEVKKLTT
jgi:2-amino-4-hydroxy-6-hydroxymethyldihydropteridine diphosphokinase